MANNEKGLPTPIPRKEKFLAKAAGMDVEIPKAITREEMYLEAIANSSGGGGFTPTQSQLDAMNSGIDSTKVAQIETNKNNILSEQAKTTGMTEGGSNYITVGGIRVYVSATAPTGTIPDGSIWIGG